MKRPVSAQPQHLVSPQRSAPSNPLSALSPLYVPRLTLDNVAEVFELPDVALLVAGREGVVDWRPRLALRRGRGERERPLVAR